MAGGERVYLYDTTLRDGAQTEGVTLSVDDKLSIARMLGELGLDYVEGGWPGANPVDDCFFANPPQLANGRLAAFGMTRRPGMRAVQDAGLSMLRDSAAEVVCIVGKASDFHVEKAMASALAENLALIEDSIGFLAEAKDEVIFDAEHFFDGYKSNPRFALDCLTTAYGAGARWVVLCDTNGGTLPHEIEAIVSEVLALLPGRHLGIHCHDDTGNAVANSLAAVRAGVRHVQGTLNGLGERCGNVDLVTLIPTLALKLGYDVGIDVAQLQQLAPMSRSVDKRLGRVPRDNAPYVGRRAFCHKAGLHASAVAKDARMYEHIDPDLVGNRRSIVVSEQSGRSSILLRLRELGIAAAAEDPRLPELLAAVKQQELAEAEASFELLAQRKFGSVPSFFTVHRCKAEDKLSWDHNENPHRHSEASVLLSISGRPERIAGVGIGAGAVDALMTAYKHALSGFFPAIEEIRPTDCAVRFAPTTADAGRVVVRIRTADGSGQCWSTAATADHVLEASCAALADAIRWYLLKQQRAAATSHKRHAAPFAPSAAVEALAAAPFPV
jgi:2-isopropylmalate synthase